MVDDKRRIEKEAMLERIAIGTANFGKKYNGVKVDDPEKILEYAKYVGVQYIDTAESYEWDYSPYVKDFKVITKVYPGQKPRPGVWAVLAHDGEIGTAKSTGAEHVGVSLYEPEVKTHYGVLQVPYSLWDRRFEKTMLHGDTIMARSIFLKGRIIEDWNAFACLSFVLMNPNVDIAVVGTESQDMLAFTLAPFVAMEKAGKDDINLLDPRKWKDAKNGME